MWRCASTLRSDREGADAAIPVIVRPLEAMTDREPFWKRKTLHAMSPAEWELLCDGCARCCLLKAEDEDSGEIVYTEVACKLLDLDTCRCTDYKRRARHVHDCVKLTPEKVTSLGWLPSTCAYRLLAEGRELYWWHPLISGSRSTVHAAGISVRGRVLPENHVGDPLSHIADWPR